MIIACTITSMGLGTRTLAQCVWPLWYSWHFPCPSHSMAGEGQYSPFTSPRGASQALALAATANSSFPTSFPGKMVNVPLEQLPLLFKVVLHSCKTSVGKEWPVPSSPPRAIRRALCGQDRLQKKEPARPTWRLWSSVSSCLHSKKRVCLFVCFVKLIFLYIYFTTELNVWPSARCTWFCVDAADAFPCSLQNVKMFNVTVLSLFRDSAFVFWGRVGWGWDDYFHNVDKDTTSVEREGVAIPTFSTCSQQTHTFVCQRANCLFLATELPGKSTYHERAKCC